MSAGARGVTVTAYQWKTLFAAQLGYLLDAFDVLLYVFALNTIREEFGLTNAQAGLVSSITLVVSALGGIVCGPLADRYGRARVMVWTILLYALASAGSATSNGLAALLIWRALVGFGLGGEWSAGAVLVSETWPPEHRGKAVAFMQSGWALGYIAAAGVSAWLLPLYGWRVLFLAGLAPAVVALWIRIGVPEPPSWTPHHTKWTEILSLKMRKQTLTAMLLAASVMLGYWGLFTWLPGFLSAPVDKGGAGFSIVKTSGWIVPIQLGAFAGYLTFGWLGDRIGRRPAFAGYVLIVAVLIPIFGFFPRIWMGPLIGFFGTGFFGIFGAMLSEMYPARIRATGVGFTYNVGRAIGAAAPYLVGATADRAGLGAGLAINSAFFLAAAFLVFRLPETRAAKLD